MSDDTTSEREWNKLFEKLLKCKQQYGMITSNDNILSTSIVGGEGQRVVDNNDNISNNDSKSNDSNNNSSFGLWLDAQEKFWKNHKLGSDEVLDNRYHRLVTLGGFKIAKTTGTGTNTKKTLSRQQLREKYWNEMYDHLLEFKQKYGHSKVPQKYNENKQLGIWVRTWRSKYREHKRTNGKKGDSKKMKRLESTGMVDDISTGFKKDLISNSNWDDMVNQVLEFKQKHGQVKIIQDCEENPELGKWVKKWRAKYRDYKRANRQKAYPEQMKWLESIGLVDDISTGYEKALGTSNNWDDMLKELLEFKNKHGHCKVSNKCNEYKKLKNWVSIWRSKYREYRQTNGQIGDPERMKRLESTGLVDDISTGYKKDRITKSNWDDMINQLLEFKQKHGHVEVPNRYTENRELGNWVTTQRSNYREYKRTNGQKGDPVWMKRLESIGVVNDI